MPYWGWVCFILRIPISINGDVMSNYSTVSIPKRVKQVLEEDKGDRDWGEYLLSLYEEARAMKREKAFKRLRELLSEDDLDRILEESRLFRRGFTLS